MKNFTISIIIFTIMSGSSHAQSFISPDENSVWEIGKTYEIKWDPSGKTDTVDIILIGDPSSNFPLRMPLYNNIPLSMGVISWTPPSSLESWAGKDFKIRLIKEVAPFINVSSELFLIVMPSTTGINSLKAAKAFSICPNPANDKLRINLNGINEGYLRIYDQKGGVYYSGYLRQAYEIDIAYLKPGLYYLCFTTGVGTHTGKLVKGVSR